MKLYRGLTKDSREVRGWYCKVKGKHYIILDDAEIKPIDPDMGGWGNGIAGFVEVIPETVGQFVCKDKNGKDVFAGALVWFWWMGRKVKAKVVKDDLFNRIVSCEGEAWGLPRTLCKSDIQRIELIEEKK